MSSLPRNMHFCRYCEGFAMPYYFANHQSMINQ